ncbi:MAG: D-2-hydroxyacid dehydrogenase [Prevotella sp.]|nr:D-2-hydroxyacid dehydrogenase [Prevotella sp.]MDD6818731.1 D-2-hydroxyacid dehydrogenase [Prevotellaceae bacterium]MDY4890931.1 D-2-hydroxyacid dehydrogenase [Prevotella sp.]
MKITVLDGYGLNPGDMSWDELKALGDVEIFDRTPREQVVERAKDSEIILTNKVKIDDEIMSQLPQLMYVGVLATGYNVVDVKAANKRGIIVTNIPTYSTDSVAQMTFAHILTISNRVEHYAIENRKGRWSNNPDFCYWDTPLVDLTGKTLGIVGLGHIGLRVAAIAKQFGMDVFAYTSKTAAELPLGIQKTTLEGLYAVSDILTLHCPLTDETRELINARSIAKMKKGIVIINTGRGQLINEHDVAEALKSGYICGYGADVMSEEPPKEDNELLLQPNAFITPHIAWASMDSRIRLMNQTVNNIKAFMNGRPINVVNR